MPIRSIFPQGVIEAGFVSCEEKVPVAIMSTQDNLLDMYMYSP